MTIRVVCVSDTHGRHNAISFVPPGDILIVAGDFTSYGNEGEVARFNNWLITLPHKHKIVIAGNHDWFCQREPARARAALSAAIYLCDQEAYACGLRIYGSPWQPWFYDWAFNLQRGEEIKRKWDLIPTGIDILVTHGPPSECGDRTCHDNRMGCADLREAVLRVKPRFHVFGHNHEGYGQYQLGATECYNVSTCNSEYEPVHAPVVIEVEVAK